MSMGFGKSLEIPLEHIREVKAHGRFRGGTLVGSAGRKLEVVLDDGTSHTFAFFLNADPDAFYAALERSRSHPAPLASPTLIGSPATNPFPKPRRTVWFWLLVVVTLAVAGVLIRDLTGFFLRW